MATVRQSVALHPTDTVAEAGSASVPTRLPGAAPTSLLSFSVRCSGRRLVPRDHGVGLLPAAPDPAPGAACAPGHRRGAPGGRRRGPPEPVPRPRPPRPTQVQLGTSSRSQQTMNAYRLSPPVHNGRVSRASQTVMFSLSTRMCCAAGVKPVFTRYCDGTGLSISPFPALAANSLSWHDITSVTPITGRR